MIYQPNTYYSDAVIMAEVKNMGSNKLPEIMVTAGTVGLLCSIYEIINTTLALSNCVNLLFSYTLLLTGTALMCYRRKTIKRLSKISSNIKIHFELYNTPFIIEFD